MKRLTKILLPMFFVVTIASAVPTEINYQGRLTDGDGNPASGSKVFGLKVYDAATGGNELYSETIGSVVVDDNGIYNFQFGAGGSSTVSVSETIDITDGSSTSFSGTPSQTPIAGTLSVTDGTYSWNEVDGNPGETATATASLVNGFVVGVTVNDGGSGYTSPPVVTINGNGTGATATAVVDAGVVTAINIDTTGSGYTEATVTVADPPAPFVVNYSGGTLDFIYESAPAAGTEIVASYQASESSIAGGLGEAESHWLELSVDGDTQSPRERVLSVPFATYSKYSQNFQINLDSVQEKSVNTIYKSEHAGFIIADNRSIATGQTSTDQVTGRIYVGETQSNLQVVREGRSGGGRVITNATGGYGPVGTINLTMPIPSGYYWKATGLTHVYFVSFAQ